jgi:predicted ATPase
MSHIGKDVFYFYGKGDNLAAYLYGIRQNSPQPYRLIVKTIQSIAPFFQDFVLEPNENGYLGLFWRDKYSESIYDVNDLSDGTLRFIALCTLFLQPNLPNTIIIDEPELGLHPRAIEKLAGLIQSAAGRGTQVIASTQSTDLVSCFNAEDIIAVDQKDGESHFERLNDKDFALWMDDFSLGDLWKQNIIGKGQP